MPRSQKIQYFRFFIFSNSRELGFIRLANVIMTFVKIIRRGSSMHSIKTTVLVVLFVAATSVFAIQAKSRNAASGTSVYVTGDTTILEAGGTKVHATKAGISDTKLEKFDGTGASVLTWKEDNAK